MPSLDHLSTPPGFLHFFSTTQANSTRPHRLQRTRATLPIPHPQREIPERHTISWSQGWGRELYLLYSPPSRTFTTRPYFSSSSTFTFRGSPTTMIASGLPATCAS